MTTKHHDDDDDDNFDAIMRSTLPELAPPRGFTDAVLHHQQQRQRHRRRWPAVMGFVGAAAAAVVVFAISTQPGQQRPAVTGSVIAAHREQLTIDGAVISLADGAALSWDGPRLRLTSGEAFFRVEPRAADDVPFVIATPAGDVVVTGTCFTVSLGAPVSPLKTALTFVAGTAIGVAVATVVVHEGSVQLQNPHGAVVVEAGQQGRLQADRAPTAAVDVARAEKRLATVLATIAASENAAAGDTTALVAENARLRHLVEKQDDELGLLDVERVDRDGEPVPFPKDLPPRLTEKALLTAFTTALKDAGVEGDVSAIDCAEFPCIVWGEMKGDSATLSASLEKSKAFAAYADDNASVRGWGNGTGTDVFAVTLTPDDPAQTTEQKDALQRRSKYRTESGFEANKPASWSEAKDK